MEIEQSLVASAWQTLEESVIYYHNAPVGTLAARDSSVDALNYDQCFIRDFVPAGLTFLIRGKVEIVRHFLTHSLKQQIKESQLDFLEPGRGLMPASFKVINDTLIADFGNHAIGRVTPVDSCFWWLFLLRAYVKATGEYEFAHSPEVQKGIRLMMELCLLARFDMYPTLLVPDGSSMIDRRMGLNGYPLEIQSLFYMSLKAALELLLDNPVDNPENERINRAVKKRIQPLAEHIRQNYWLDIERLNTIYRYKGEEYGEKALNQFNIYSDSIPYTQLSEWMPEDGGYLAGNLGPSQLDCRFFSLGNLMAILSSLTTEEQSQAIMTVIERKWEDLIGYMPMKICFPALKDRDWQLLTGCDPKNRPWSYHNAGNWPVLLWLLTAASQKVRKEYLAEKAIAIAAKRLLKDEWAEYYDGKNGRLVGKEARKYQTWSVAGFLLSYELINNPEHLKLITFD